MNVHKIKIFVNGYKEPTKMNKSNETTNRFDMIPALTRLEPYVREEIKTIKDIIINTISAERIYLFGSYAY
ncbi:MAG: hypothetical protein LBE18_11605, partial [Planctomycetaceae bacterium]|nr:hypothetical protein [Planctomycetaceae bacterium]